MRGPSKALREDGRPRPSANKPARITPACQRPLTKVICFVTHKEFLMRFVEAVAQQIPANVCYTYL